MFIKKFFSIKIHVWVVCLIVIVITSLVLLGIFIGKITIFNNKTESSETQVVTAMKKEKQVAVLGLSVTDIYDKSQITTFFGIDVPFSEKTSYIKGTFDAKLGFDGKKVEISKSKIQENTYNIVIPQFTVVGISNPEFEVINNKGEILSFATEDIDTLKMANTAMSDKTLNKYIKLNKEWLEEQSQSYYEGILKSVNPDLKLNFKFE